METTEYLDMRTRRKGAWRKMFYSTARKKSELKELLVLHLERGARRKESTWKELRVLHLEKEPGGRNYGFCAWRKEPGGRRRGCWFCDWRKEPGGGERRKGCVSIQSHRNLLPVYSAAFL